MFDFLRDLNKSEDEKRQEALTAYLDDTLTPRDKARFEQLLASDESLRASLEEQRLISATMRRLPRLRAPRSFTLDPALYGRPVSSTNDRLYPILRTATAVVAILFVVVLVLDFAPFGATDQAAEDTLAESQMQAMEAPAPAEALAPMEPEAEQALVAGTAIEVTREVEAIEEAAEMAAEAPMADEAALEMEAPAEEPAEEIVAEEAEAPLAAEDALGDGAPAQEAPRADEGQPPALEAEADEERDGDTSRLPLVSAPAATAAAIGEVALTEEAALSQPTPSPATRAAPAAGDDVTGTAAAETAETAAPKATGDLSTLQILAIVLGLALVILALVTLALRRGQR
jgi:hypothetical protein